MGNSDDASSKCSSVVEEEASLYSVPDDTKTFDGLLIHHLGQFGRFQWFLFLSLSVVALAATWHNMIHVFTGAIPGMKCISNDQAHGNGNKTLVHWNQAFSLPHLNQVGPLNNFSDSACENDQDQCYISSEGNCSEEYDGVPCTSWIYDKSQYTSSIVTEWDLVCNKQWLVSFVQSLHMAGCLIGSLVFGQVSDRYGRRPVLLATTLMEVVIGIATAFMPIFELYALCRFLVGIAISAQFNSAYIIAIELVGPKWRSIAGIMMMYLSALSIMLMAGLAYLVRDWTHLQLVISAPLALLLTYFLVAPESPRWLLVHNKMKRSKSLITKLAKYNGKQLPHDIDEWLNNEGQTHSEDGRRYSAMDLFRFPRIRFRSIALCCLWFVVSVTYYGLSLYTSNLGGDDYLNFFLSGAVELPAYTFSIWCLTRFGRRIPLGIAMVMSGVSLIVTSPFGDDRQVLRIVFSMAGKMFISVAYVIMYPFSAEIFPTVIRSNGLGFTSMGARIGGFVAPYILLLGQYSTAIPLVVCGVSAFAGGIVILFLPETHNQQLPETIEDAEDIPNNSIRTLFKCCQKNNSQKNNSDTKIERHLDEKYSSQLFGSMFMPVVEVASTPTLQKRHHTHV